MAGRIQSKVVELGYRKPDGGPDAMRFCREKGYLSQYVYEWLKGRVPGEENLTRLAKDFGVSKVWLRYGDEGVDEVLNKRRRLGERPARYRPGQPPERRPLKEPGGSLEERIARLEAEGLISRNPAPPRRFRPVARRPGALRRFLESRE